ncbi:MAG TPA: hypothetical protein VMC04_23070 [Verrucomicrobiae bacterium]|nr:hypothetical protein [Verrucomicrobiae bacterium]
MQQALAFQLLPLHDEGLARVGDRASHGIGLVGGVALGVDRHPRPALRRVHALDADREVAHAHQADDPEVLAVEAIGGTVAHDRAGPGRPRVEGAEEMPHLVGEHRLGGRVRQDRGIEARGLHHRHPAEELGHAVLEPLAPLRRETHERVGGSDRHLAVRPLQDGAERDTRADRPWHHVLDHEADLEGALVDVGDGLDRPAQLGLPARNARGTSPRPRPGG